MPGRDHAGWTNLDLEGPWMPQLKNLELHFLPYLECVELVLWLGHGPLRSSHRPSYTWFSNKTLLLSTEEPTQALSQLCPPQSMPTTTHKVHEVLAAAESGSSSPEQWKNKLLKGLFPCSEYFYKANPQGLSPHTQLFLSFLTRSPRWALGDGKWRQGGGSCSWLWVH